MKYSIRNRWFNYILWSGINLSAAFMRMTADKSASGGGYVKGVSGYNNESQLFPGLYPPNKGKRA